MMLESDTLILHSLPLHPNANNDGKIKDKKKMISDDRRRIKWFEDRLWEWQQIVANTGGDVIQIYAYGSLVLKCV